MTAAEPPGAVSSRPVGWLPLLTATGTALLVLGPALGPGVVLTYDLAWSPDPRWTPFSLGQGTPAPRAVPSDAAGVLLGHLFGAGPAQVLVLVGILVLAGTGAARLVHALGETTTAATTAATIAGIWNPFVLERLVAGQWTVLLGCAAVPHLLLGARRARSDPRAARLVAAGVAVCGVGGANTLLVALLAVLPVLALPRPRWVPLGWVLSLGLGAAAVWALPALTAGVASTDTGTDAFAPRADTPLGPVLSLLSGGGFWNPATHPTERGTWLLGTAATLVAIGALAAAVSASRRAGLAALLVPGALGLAAAVVAVVDPAGLWTGLLDAVPGGGLLRDTHKLVAPLVALAAAGSGVLVAAASRVASVGPAAAVLVAALPVATLPSLAWGVQGRVAAVEVPPGLRSVASTASAAPAGPVGLLPWSQYRRYAWNEDRVSLTLVPRMVGQRVVYDDGLPLSDRRVPGEDPLAARVTGAIAAGTDPVEALRAAGVRYLLVERRVGAAGPGADVTPPAGSRVLADSPEALLVDLASAGQVEEPTPVAAGWAVTALTWLVAVALVGHAVVGFWGRRRGHGYRLVQSRP